MDPAGGKTGRHLTSRQYIAIGIVLCIVLLIVALLVLHPAVQFTEPAGPVYVKILAVNDLHGQLPAGQSLAGEPAGSAPVLASYLRAAENESPVPPRSLRSPAISWGHRRRSPACCSTSPRSFSPMSSRKGAAAGRPPHVRSPAT